MKTHPVLPLLVLAVATWGCSRQPDAFPVVKVEVEAVQAAELSHTVTLTGEVRAKVESSLGFRIDGRLAERLVEAGDHVMAGQILARLESPELRYRLAAAEADVQAARAKLRNESSNLARQQFLRLRKASTQAEYDAAEEAFRTAQSAYAAAGAQLGSARDALAQTELRADHDGTIIERAAESGQVVAAGQCVFRLAHDGARDAVFNVNQTVFGDRPIDRDVPVRIHLVADPAVHVTGKVREVTPTLSGAGGTVTVKVGLDHWPPAFALGAAVRGMAPLPAGAPSAITVPAGALTSLGDRPCVWIVNPETMAVSARPVTVAGYDNGRVIVGAGLRSGDLVVARNAQKMSPNKTVAFVEKHQP